jgi:hypothetical protein
MTASQCISTGRPLIRLYHSNEEATLKWMNLCRGATMMLQAAACRLLQSWMLHAVLVVMATGLPTLETSHRYRERLVIVSFCSYLLSAVPGTRDDDCHGV